ncbi:MAG: metallophosphoesterase [Actinobacteria bacterium]|nr:metallophosphoesterase [Actinomycetota bacterium]
MTRRHWIHLFLGFAMLAVGVLVLVAVIYPITRWRMDLVPGSPPEIALRPEAWSVSEDSATFVILGDNGTGGRNSMDIATQMALTYEETPYGLVVLLGDISYYGSIADRYEEVFLKPLGPLLDAGVTFELAVGNHELEYVPSSEANQEIVRRIEEIGAEGAFYSVVHGPVEIFIIDSSTPQVTGAAGPDQVTWLRGALAASTAPWKVAALHHPPYSSGGRGSSVAVREALEPLFVEYGVDLVLTGHDHHYERTVPIQGVTYVVSGAGSKLRDAGTSDFTAVVHNRLQFMIAEAIPDEIRLQTIGVDGAVIDEFTLVKEQ